MLSRDRHVDTKKSNVTKKTWVNRRHSESIAPSRHRAHFREERRTLPPNGVQRRSQAEGPPKGAFRRPNGQYTGPLFIDCTLGPGSRRGSAGPPHHACLSFTGQSIWIENARGHVVFRICVTQEATAANF